MSLKNQGIGIIIMTIVLTEIFFKMYVKHFKYVI